LAGLVLARGWPDLPDTALLRRQIDDDATITDDERQATDKTVAELVDLSRQADSTIAQMPKLIEDIRAKMRQIDEQQKALGNAITNRDGF
jgi:ABC-type Fe3+-hydroxamate transport system substrate-binding protein